MNLKETRHVERIGVSVYNPDELDRVVDVFEPDVVQAPVNIFDRRMLHSATLKRLVENGTEFHARSAFLQGVLLCDPDALPTHVVGMKPFLETVAGMAAKAGLNLIEAALGFVLAQDMISAVVIGADSPSQLEEIVAASRTFKIPDDFSSLPDLPPALLDPRRWARA